MFQSIQVSAEVAMWAIANFLVLLSVVGVGRLAYRWTISNAVKEVEENSNPAMAVAFGGYIVGLAIASAGALIAPGPGTPLAKLALVAGSGLASVILMRLSLFINDKFILSNFSNIAEITKDKNMGVAFVEAGGCLATGFMIYAVMTCQAMSLEDKVVDGLVYWAIGQALLVAGAYIFGKTLPYDAHAEIGNSNSSAAGLTYGGFLLALGLVLMTAISGATSNIVDELGTIAVFYTVGMVLLLAVRFVASLVLTSKSKIVTPYNKGSLGIMVLEFVSILCVGILFVASLSPANTSAIFAESKPSISISITEAEAK